MANGERSEGMTDIAPALPEQPVADRLAEALRMAYDHGLIPMSAFNAGMMRLDSRRKTEK